MHPDYNVVAKYHDTKWKWGVIVNTQTSLRESQHDTHIHQYTSDS